MAFQAAQIQSQSSLYSVETSNSQIIEPTDANKSTIDSILSSTFLTNHWFVIWRIFGAMYCLLILVWSFFDDASNFFLFLTCWSIFLTTNYLLLVCGLTIQKHYGHRCTSSVNTNRLCALSHTLQQINCSLALLVVAAYWYFIGEVNALAIHTHGVSAVIATIDFILSANQMHSLSVFKPLIVTVLYAVLTIILNFGFDRQMYVALDWKLKPKTGVFNTFLCLALLTIFHGMLVLIKRWILHNYVPPKTKVSDNQSAKSPNDGVTDTNNVKLNIYEDDL